jgi:hypothetical protein
MKIIIYCLKFELEIFNVQSLTTYLREKYLYNLSITFTVHEISENCANKSKLFSYYFVTVRTSENCENFESLLSLYQIL